MLKRGVLLALLVGATSVAMARPGRVVRIERAGGGGTAVICDRVGGQQNCYGTRPPVGALGIMVGPDGSDGQFRVTALTEVVAPACRTEGVWRYEGVEVARASAGSGDGERRSWLIFGGGLDPTRSRFLPQEPHPPELAADGGLEWLSFDGDGDGKADLAFGARACDGGSMNQSDAVCLTTYQHARTGWRATGASRIRGC